MALSIFVEVVSQIVATGGCLEGRLFLSAVRMKEKAICWRSADTEVDWDRCRKKGIHCDSMDC